MKLTYKNTREVYNKLGKSYLDASKKITPWKRLDFAKLFSKGEHVLDLGCGGGRDAKFFTQRGLKVLGIDNSSVLIRLAKKEAPKAKFICSDMLKVILPKNSFNGIWAEASLLHLKRKDISKVLRRLYIILNKDGIIYVSLKKGKGEADIEDKLSGGYKRFYTYFSKKEASEFLKKAGFKIISSEIKTDQNGRKEVLWIVLLAKKK